MLIVPTQPHPSQVITITLASQPCMINIYQKSTGLYIDLYLNSAPIVTGVICENANRIVRDAYFGFVGDLMFVDTQDSADPTYDGLGTRYLLFYVEESDLQAVGLSG